MINYTPNLKKVLRIMKGYLGSVLHRTYHRAPFMGFRRTIMPIEIIEIVNSDKRKG